MNMPYPAHANAAQNHIARRMILVFRSSGEKSLLNCSFMDVSSYNISVSFFSFGSSSSDGVYNSMMDFLTSVKSLSLILAISCKTFSASSQRFLPARNLGVSWT